MRLRHSAKVFLLSILAIILSACVRPPHNDFQPHHRTIGGSILGAGLGGTVAAATEGSISAGMTAGGLVGFMVSSYMDSRQGLQFSLSRQGVQIIHYGDIVTMLIPTDNFFYFDSPELFDIEYPVLNDVVKYIRTYPDSPIYIAAFQGDAGTERDQDRLTKHRAEMMMTYLWAHGLHFERLHAMGYGSRFPIADNHFVEGSAMNRRLEIQWRAHRTFI